MSSPATLIIKLNENPMPNDCPLCGEQTNPNIGAELFLAGTESIVCIDCGSKHAPLLACPITFADMSRWFQSNDNPVLADFLNFAELSNLTERAENRFGAKWEDESQFKRSPMNVYQSFGIQKSEVQNVG